MSNAAEQAPEPVYVELKSRGWAALLTWLVPGLGQLYQGRRAKALIFFVCIFGTYSYGLALGGGRVVYAPTRDAGEQFRFKIGNFRLAVGWRQLQFVTQAAVGLPTIPAIVAANLPAGGTLPLTGGNKWFVPPDSEELDQLYLLMPRRFEMGTLFTLVAGLLNILAIFDAYSGPAFPASKESEEDDEGKEVPDPPPQAADKPPPPKSKEERPAGEPAG